MRFVNLTPHVIKLCVGEIITQEIPASGTVARVASRYTEFDSNGISSVEFGAVENLPAPAADTTYIVSGMVATAVKRADVVSPATGHPAVIRANGQIVAVPGFVRA